MVEVQEFNLPPQDITKMGDHIEKAAFDILLSSLYRRHDQYRPYIDARLTANILELWIDS